MLVRNHIDFVRRADQDEAAAAGSTMRINFQENDDYDDAQEPEALDSSESEPDAEDNAVVQPAVGQEDHATSTP
eukprot:6197877-Pleurochrysis_carterae.AAC.2